MAKLSKIRLALMGGLLSGAALLITAVPANAQNYCTNTGCYGDYLLESVDGGNLGVYSYSTGEYSEGYTACGINFYLSYTVNPNLVAGYTAAARLVRRSDNQIMCRWGGA